MQSPETVLQALSTLSEIEGLLMSTPSAPNKLIEQRVKHLCASLGVRDSYIVQVANKIASRTAVLFSTRKHQTYPGGESGLRQELAGHVRSIRQHLEYLSRTAP